MSIEALKTADEPHAIEIRLQTASQDIWDKKYRLKDKSGNPVDATIDATYSRVAKALSGLFPMRARWPINLQLPQLTVRSPVPCRIPCRAFWRKIWRRV